MTVPTSLFAQGEGLLEVILPLVGENVSLGFGDQPNP